MPDNTLSKLLQQFCKGVVSVTQTPESKEISRFKELYQKPNITHFEYKEGSCNRQRETNYLEKEITVLQNPTDLVAHLEMYVAIVSAVREQYKAEEHHTCQLLVTLAQRTISKSGEGLSEEEINDLIGTLINDLDQAELYWEVEVWIDGVWLEQEKYELSHEVIFRQPRAADFEKEIPVHSLAFSPYLPLHSTPSAIINVRGRRNGDLEIRHEIEVIINALRLVGVGSVFQIKTELFPRSFLRHAFGLSSEQSCSRNYIYKFRTEDVKRLLKVIHQLKELLPKRIEEPVPKRKEAVLIALQRYGDALTKRDGIENRITLTITALEALLLGSDERMELDRRLSQRISCVLRTLGLDPLQIYDSVRKAYSIRSAYIHGAKLKGGSREEASQLVEKLLEWTRKCLLVFLQLHSTNDKRELIKMIDSALLDERIAVDLKTKIVSSCSVI